MSKINSRQPAGMLGVALAGLVLSGTAFAVEPLAQGYMLAASHAAAEQWEFVRREVDKHREMLRG